MSSFYIFMILVMFCFYRIELMQKMDEFPGLKCVISLKDLKPGQWEPE